MIARMSLGTHLATSRSLVVRAVFLAMTAALLTSACGDSPTTPSPSGLTVTCPSPITVAAASVTGTPVTFAAPVATGGTAPVTVSCSVPSGQLFPIGLTQVTCTARDAVSQLSACAFDIRVSTPPRLSRTRFLAFGDSITAGEVTAPLSTPGGWWPLIVVPTSSYPTLLNERLRSTFIAQAISMTNAGQPGQSATAALGRFQSEMARVQPEVVLLLMGYNDLVTSATMTAAANALAAMVREGRSRGARVILGTLTPTITGRQRSLDTVLLDQMNTRIRTIAAADGALLLDLHQGFQPAISAWIGVDGLHPNEAGYVRMAELFFDAIRTDLEVR
jgi:lysophospholipase L1-like esterase